MNTLTLFDQQMQIPAASLANPQTLAFPSTVNLAEFLEGLDLEFQGRLAIGTAAGTGVLPEAPYNLFRRIRVKINHRVYGSLNLIDLPASTIVAINNLYNKIQENVQGSTLGTGVGNYDLDFHVSLHFPLRNVADVFAANTLLDAPRCSAVTVELVLGTGADLVTPGGTTTFTWSAFGSTTGNPVVNLSRRIVPGFAKTMPLTNLLMQHDRVDTLTSNVTAGSPNGQPLPVGNLYRLIGFKQYTQNSTSQDVAATLLNPVLPTDSGLTRTQLFQNAVAFMDFFTWQQLRNYTYKTYGFQAQTGYGIIDFVRDGIVRPNSLLDTRILQARNGQLNYGGQINGVANGTVEVILHEVMPNPQIPRSA